MFKDSYLKRIAKLKASVGSVNVLFRSLDGSIFALPKRRVVSIYLSIFRGEVSKENTAVLASDVVTPGEGSITTLLRMMQE